MPRIPEPKQFEPIRRIETQSGHRYRVVMDVATKGARRKQVTKTFTTLTQARAFVVITKGQITKGTFLTPSKTTLNELADEWLAYREADVLSGKLRRITLDNYATWLKSVRRYMGHRTVAGLVHSDVEGFKTWALREGNSKTKTPSPLGNDAVAGALGVLTRVLHLAVLDRKIKTNPALEVDKPSREQKVQTTRGYWTRAQIKTFCQHADAEQPLVWTVALRLILCGFRRSEALGLSWDAVDLEAGTVEVRQGRVQLKDGTTKIGLPKSPASARVVPVDVLNPGTTAMLRTLRKQQAAFRLRIGPTYGESAAEQGLVLVDSVGQPLRPESLSDRFWAVSAAAGLPRIKMHEVRHSIATDLAADPTVSDIDAAALLGHDVAVFHSTYAQRTHEAAARAAAAYGARFQDAQ